MAIQVPKGHRFSKKQVVELLGLTGGEVRTLTKSKFVTLDKVQLRGLFELQLFMVLRDFGFPNERAHEIVAGQYAVKKTMTVLYPPKISRPGKAGYRPRDIMGISGIIEMRINKNAIEKLVRKKLSKMEEPGASGQKSRGSGQGSEGSGQSSEVGPRRSELGGRILFRKFCLKGRNPK